MSKLKDLVVPDFSGIKIARFLTVLKRSVGAVVFVREPVLVSHLTKMYSRLQLRSSVDVQFWAACLILLLRI